MASWQPAFRWCAPIAGPFDRKGAAIPKGTSCFLDSGVHANLLRRLRWNRIEPARTQLGHGVQEEPRVGMMGRFEHEVSRSLLHDASRVEHGD